MALLYGMDRHQNPLVFIYQAENEKTKQHPRTYYFWAISQIKLIAIWFQQFLQGCSCKDAILDHDHVAQTEQR